MERRPGSVNVVLVITAFGTIFLGLLPSKTLAYLLPSNLLNR
jgi:hypothetical protein